MKMNRQILSLLMSAVLLLALFAGCGNKGNSDSGSVSSSSLPASSGPQAEAVSGTVSTVIPDFLDEIAEKKEKNGDTVGWLRVPGTMIDDVVVCNFDDNRYYLRRNFDKEYSFNGIFYADRRSVFGSGSADELGINTCIYGHAMTDDITAEKFDVMFGPLHDFREPDFAKDSPYIFFSTEKENLAFEVFAVFIANSDNTSIPYNRNDIEPAEFYKMVREELLPRSLYNYNTEIKDGDKFLTLSTCIYTLPDGTPTNYPDTFYRYVVMGKLVSPDEPLKEQADFEIAEDPLVEPDTFKR